MKLAPAALPDEQLMNSRSLGLECVLRRLGGPSILVRLDNLAFCSGLVMTCYALSHWQRTCRPHTVALREKL